ncbi:hypothetical protein ZHAS_00010279 [Anopheles sinensis]|uniref:Uncharacterized protein n=1 Tax=Anopheles sinensis TaxID=74873 RepID=A0A084VX71_ANOSI|nr:hypothetical protein ZHAS_00010279 [Anopheles sinensis]
MDAAGSATAIAQQQQQQPPELPFLANTTVYAIGGGDGGELGPSTNGCCKSNANDTTTPLGSDSAGGRSVLLLLQRSNATPCTAVAEEAPASAPPVEATTTIANREEEEEEVKELVVVVRGSSEDSHFDSSLSGAQPQLHQQPQFTDFSNSSSSNGSEGAQVGSEGAPAPGGDVKDQIAVRLVAEVKRENGEGTQPNPEPSEEAMAEERQEVAVPGGAERLMFITALASGGAAAAAAPAPAAQAVEAATLGTSTTTTTTTTTAKKCPLEFDEVAENHNTLATVAGDHGAATATAINDGASAVVASVEPPQQVVYVRSGSDSEGPTKAAKVTPLVLCSADPANSNVVRIQIIPEGEPAAPEDLQQQNKDGNVRGTVPGGWSSAGSGLATSSSVSGVSVSSASAPGAASPKCPSSKVVTVVSFGSDGSGSCRGVGSVVVGDRQESRGSPERTFDLAEVVFAAHHQQQLQVGDIGGGDLQSSAAAPEHGSFATTVCCTSAVLSGVVIDVGDARTSLVASPNGEVWPGQGSEPLIDDDEMVQKKSMTLATVAAGGGVGGMTSDLDSPSPYVYYLGPRPTSTGGGRTSTSSSGRSSSGQCSPSDMLDSGTCSDIELTPPPLPKKMSQRGSKPSSMTTTPSTTAALTALPIKHNGGPGAPGDKTTATATATADAVINQQALETTPEFQHHHLEFHRLNHNQTHQHLKQQQHLLHNGNDDDDDDDQHHQRDEEQDRQDGKHQTHVDLTQNGFAARQQQQQQQPAGSVIVSDSDGSESCLSCDSLNFEHLSGLQQPSLPVEHSRVATPPPPPPPKQPSDDDIGNGTLTLGGEFEQQERRAAPFRAGNVCGLPDSLLAAIRESRPKVYCNADEDQQQQQQQQQEQKQFEPVTNRSNGSSVVEQLELLMPTTTTRSILMDKINSLEQSMQGRYAVGDQPDASSNHQHQHHHHLQHHAINSDAGGRAQSSCSTAGSVTTESVRSNHFESDRFYKFHIHEHVLDGAPGGTSSPETTPSVVDDDESFAGLKDLSNGTSTIRSNKGTVRGVKNRVRNGIATFLQMQQTGMKKMDKPTFGVKPRKLSPDKITKHD